MRVNAVIQARMGSSRLPGKVLRPLGPTELDREPVLGWVVRAVRAARGLDGVVVATTGERVDDEVAALARDLGVAVVRGPEDDVLTRFLQAVDEHPCDAVVRLTADCPLLDPALISLVVAVWRQDPSYHYVSTTLVPTLPRGLDVELATVPALVDVSARTRPFDRMHVTSGLYADPQRYRLLGLVVSPSAADLRVTLDTDEDAELLDGLVAALGRTGPVGWQELVATLRSRPDLVALNAGVVQKPLEVG